MKHKTYATFVITGDSISTDLADVRMNDLNDPFGTYSAIQPEGFDLLKTIYDRYCVTHVSCRSRIRKYSDNTFTTITPTNEYFMWSNPGPNGMLELPNFEKAKEAGVKMVYVNTDDAGSEQLAGNAKVKSDWHLTKYMAIADNLATTVNLEYAEVNTAATSAGPSNICFLNMHGSFRDNGALPFLDFLTVEIELTQYAIYYKLKPAVQDS